MAIPWGPIIIGGSMLLSNLMNKGGGGGGGYSGTQTTKVEPYAGPMPDPDGLWERTLDEFFGTPRSTGTAKRDEAGLGFLGSMMNKGGGGGYSGTQTTEKERKCRAICGAYIQS